MSENNTPKTDATPTPTGVLTFDGVDYPIASLSEQARTLLTNVRVTEQEIARLRQQTAITQTARTAYLQALKNELPKT